MSANRYHFYVRGTGRFPEEVSVPGSQFCCTLREAALAALLSGLPIIAIKLKAGAGAVRPNYARTIYEVEEHGDLPNYLAQQVVRVKRRDGNRRQEVA